MSSKSEHTQAQNISNFSLVIDIIESFGPIYKPSNTALLLKALVDQRNKMLVIDQEFKDKRTIFSIAIDDQQLEYEGLSKLITQVLSAFKASGASAKSLETLQTITRKIKGERSAKIKPVEDGKSAENNNISVAQLSYANRASNFAAMISFLRAEPKYAPNEYALSTGGLQEKLDELNSAYQAVSLIQAPLTAIAIRRIEALYHPETGLINTVKLVKAYVKSLFGTQSAQYKQITAIQFRGKKL